MALALPVPLDLLERVVDHWTGDRPRYRPDRCTAARHDRSTCRNCETACPAGALRLDPAARLVDIDTASCTGCDACVAACPTGALTARQPAHQSPVVCSRAADAGPSGTVVTCLGGAGPTALLALAGAADVELVVGDCRTCPLGEAGARAAGHVAAANRVLATLGVSHRVTITARPRPPDLAAAPPRQPARTLSRRGLFRSLGASARTSAAVALSPEPDRDVLAWVDPARPSPPLTAGAALATLAVDDTILDTVGLPAGTPRVDQGCDGCGACAAFCPTAALRLTGDDAHATLTVDVAACVACGLCEAVCPRGVIAVDATVGTADLRAGDRPLWNGVPRRATPGPGPLTAAAFAAALPAPSQNRPGGTPS